MKVNSFKHKCYESFRSFLIKLADKTYEKNQHNRLGMWVAKTYVTLRIKEQDREAAKMKKQFAPIIKTFRKNTGKHGIDAPIHETMERMDKYKK